MTGWPLRTAVLSLALSYALAPGRQAPGSPDAWDRFRGSAATGKKVWEFTAGAPLSASPAAAGGGLIIGSQDGTLFCFR